MANTISLKEALSSDKKESIKKSRKKKYNKYVTVFRKLLLLNEQNNLAITLKNIQELLSFSEKIFSSSSVAETFLYFCLNGAATAWVLQSELNIPEATVYRALKRLRAMKILVPALKVSKMKRSKGGPRPTVWALDEASSEEIAEALKLHYKMLSPKYRVAEDVAQTILEEYSTRGKLEEINYRDIIVQVKELSLPFKTPDVADLAAQYLHERGIKVWR
jgi:predicted transcriptional regulator